MTLRDILDMDLDKETLVCIAEKLDLDSVGTKDKLERRIKNYLPKEEKKITKEKPTGKKRVEKHSQESEDQEEEGDNEETIQRSKRSSSKDFDSLVKDVSQWIPRRRYPSEDGYHADLASFLDHRSNYRVQTERGDSRVDILINGKFPIELKKNPTQSEYDRLVGQLLRHKRAFGRCIVVICDVRRREMLEGFEYDFKKDSTIKIIVK
jgi:hypothetical protein